MAAPSPVNRLPDELMVQLLRRCDTPTVVRLTASSRRMRAVGTDYIARRQLARRWLLRTEPCVAGGCAAAVPATDGDGARCLGCRGILCQQCEMRRADVCPGCQSFICYGCTAQVAAPCHACHDTCCFGCQRGCPRCGVLSCPRVWCASRCNCGSDSGSDSDRDSSAY